MDIVKFNQTGGFPLTTNILNEMQKAYSIFNDLGSIAGNFSIISGCKVTGSNVSEGVVFINGELYPFKGGKLNSKVKIKESFESKDFEDGSNNKVVFRYHVEFGSAVKDCFKWSDFKRIQTNQELEITLEKRIKKLENLIKKTLPIGLVAVWDRPANKIPVGWVEHTELSGRTAVGYDSSYKQNNDQEDYRINEKGFNGGEREHILKNKEMPNIKIPLTTIQDTSFDDDSVHEFLLKRSALIHSDDRDMEEHKEWEFLYEARQEAHNNMQPYRVVRYIRFIGFN